MAVMLPSALLRCVEDSVDLLLGEQLVPGLQCPVQVVDATVCGVVSFVIFFIFFAHLAEHPCFFSGLITITVVAIATVAIGAIIARGILGVGVATSSTSGYLLGKFPGASTLPYQGL